MRNRVNRGAPRRGFALLLAAAAALGAAVPGSARAWAVPEEAASSASPRPHGEYEVKAAMLYNFATLVEWPASTFRGPGGPLDLCVFGEDPFGDWLEKTFSDRAVHGRLVRISRYTRIRDLGSCHLMFISDSVSRHLPVILESLWGTPVLTVGEAPDFSAAGGMIRFHIEDSKVRFELNQDVAARAGLRVDRKLLELSRHAAPGEQAAGDPPAGSRASGDGPDHE